LRAALEHSPLGVDVTRFAQTWNLANSQMQTLLRQTDAHLVGPPDALLAIAAPAWSSLLTEALAALAAEHERAADMIGVGRERLRRLAAPALPQAAFDAVVAELMSQGRIAQSGPWLHTQNHRVRLTAAEDKLWERVGPLLQQAPFQPPRVRDLAGTLLLEEDAMRQLLKRVARTGEVYPVAHDHYFARSAVAELAEIARELGERSGGINAAEFRDRVGTGRKLAIHILEFFDRVGFTRRVKDSHVLRQPGLFR